MDSCVIYTNCGARNLRTRPTLYQGPKAHAEEPYCQGRTMKVLWRPKDVAEDDFTPNISPKCLKKRTDSVQEQHEGEGCQHLNVEPSAWQTHTYTMLSSFSQPLGHEDWQDE